MDETSFIGKILCALALAAVLGWFLSSTMGGLLANSATTEVQIFWVKGIAGFGGAVIGGWLGWANSELIITGAIYSTIASLIMRIFSL